MAISLNSFVSFNSTLQARYQCVSRCSGVSTWKKATQLTPFFAMFGLGVCVKRRAFCLSVADSDRLATDASDKVDPGGTAETLDSVGGHSLFQTSVDDESGMQTPKASNGATVSSGLKQEMRSNSQSTTKRSPLTARERLRAAKVLSRYSKSKPLKSEMGRKVLDAMKESDGGKRRSGLPEAPINLFDDSKRGLPKAGWTFQFPGGSDLFLIVFSVVFISTVMFTTTYIVWKAGAIHFNEY